MSRNLHSCLLLISWAWVLVLDRILIRNLIRHKIVVIHISLLLGCITRLLILELELGVGVLLREVLLSRLNIVLLIDLVW